MRDYDLTVLTFEMGTAKEAALKPLEEAAEAFASWQDVHGCDYPLNKCETCSLCDVCKAWCDLADEIADTIQAACNLAARYDIDLQAAMERCEQRNRNRGRYEVDKPEPIQMSESAKRVFDRLMKGLVDGE